MSSGGNPSIAASIRDQNDAPRIHTLWQLATEGPCLSYRASGHRFLGFFVCVCHRSWHQTSTHHGTAKIYSTCHHKRNLGGGRVKCPPPQICMPKNTFLATEMKRGEWKNCGERGKGSMYITGWLKPIVPLFQTWLFHEVPTTHGRLSPPHAISQIAPKPVITLPQPTARSIIHMLFDGCCISIHQPCRCPSGTVAV